MICTFYIYPKNFCLKESHMDFIFLRSFKFLLSYLGLWSTLEFLYKWGKGCSLVFYIRIFENSIETCILSRVKQITSPGWMHETSARTWCTGKTQRDRVEREVGGGIGMGNTWKSMANSCQCMTKITTIL